nr:DUF4105 domain-containing protein [Alteromonas sp. ASW11-130]
MHRTLDLIINHPAKACNYPARKRFLEKFLALKSGTLSPVKCEEYDEYAAQVPVDELSLVYAAENVTQASSMLGHIMLKLSGTRGNGIPVEHGVTFFTELDTINVPFLLWETLYEGKNGYFKVGPFNEFSNYYLNAEARNIWDYKIDVEPFKLALLKDHIWELGKSELYYYFHSYNCATVTQILISLATNSTFTKEWLTPLDVVKFVNDNNVIQRAHVTPSTQWRLRSLSEEISNQNTKVIKDFITKEKALPLHSGQIIEYEYAKALNEFMYKTDVISRQKYQGNKFDLEEFGTALPDYSIDAADYKNPLNVSPEAEISMGLLHREQVNWLTIGYFPVASTLDDDKRNVFGETALTLSSVKLLIDVARQNVELDSWKIYDMKSHIPFDTVTKGVSTGFSFGFEQRLRPSIGYKLTSYIDVSSGIAFEPHTDLGVFAQLKLGASASDSAAWVYGKLTLGSHLYAIGNSKLRVESSFMFNDFNSSHVNQAYTLRYIKYFKKQWLVTLSASKENFNQNREEVYGLELKYRY